MCQARSQVRPDSGPVGFCSFNGVPDWVLVQVGQVRFQVGSSWNSSIKVQVCWVSNFLH